MENLKVLLSIGWGLFGIFIIMFLTDNSKAILVTLNSSYPRFIEIQLLKRFIWFSCQMSKFAYSASSCFQPWIIFLYFYLNTIFWVNSFPEIILTTIAQKSGSFGILFQISSNFESSLGVDLDERHKTNLNLNLILILENLSQSKVFVFFKIKTWNFHGAIPSKHGESVQMVNYRVLLHITP